MRTDRQIGEVCAGRLTYRQAFDGPDRPLSLSMCPNTTMEAEVARAALGCLIV
jgi:hypothetical protein